MPVFTDQTGRSIAISQPPKRIISLVPSQTEFLFELGLEDAVVGITKFCVHPQKWFRNKTKVGGTKQVNIEIIRKLEPDLVIANKEENIKSQVEELENECPVWISDVNNLNSAYQMMEQIGCLTNTATIAKEIIAAIKEEFRSLPDIKLQLKTCYLIWQKPYMTIGGDSFIHSILQTAGLENVFKDYSRYPEISVLQLQSLQPDLLLLSSEPFPFRQKHIDELQPFFPKTEILLVDGELFSWYGSRLRFTPRYLSNLFQYLQQKNHIQS